MSVLLKDGRHQKPTQISYFSVTVKSINTNTDLWFMLCSYELSYKYYRTAQIYDLSFLSTSPAETKKRNPFSRDLSYSSFALWLGSPCRVGPIVPKTKILKRFSVRLCDKSPPVDSHAVEDTVLKLFESKKVFLFQMYYLYIHTFYLGQKKKF